MSREAVVRAYLRAMEASDLDGVLECFEADAIVRSPVYGEVLVRSFYERLFADTTEAKVDIYGLYGGLDQPNKMAAHFGYVWLKRDGSRISTDLVDLFEFSVSGDRISRLSIIFDTAARNQFEARAGHFTDPPPAQA